MPSGRSAAVAIIGDAIRAANVPVVIDAELPERIAEIVREHRLQHGWKGCHGISPEGQPIVVPGSHDTPSNVDSNGLIDGIVRVWRDYARQSGAELAKVLDLEHVVGQCVVDRGGFRLDVIGPDTALDDAAIVAAVTSAIIGRGGRRYDYQRTGKAPQRAWIGDSPLAEALYTAASFGLLDGLDTMTRGAFAKVVANVAGVSDRTVRAWIADEGGVESALDFAADLVRKWQAQRARMRAETAPKPPTYGPPRGARIDAWTAHRSLWFGRQVRRPMPGQLAWKGSTVVQV